MKPDKWIIEDIGNMRKKVKSGEASYEETSYLDLLQWYVKVINGKGE